MTLAQDRSTSDWLNRRLYPFASHFIEVEGGRMHYIDEGQGTPVLFVHGWPLWSFCFREVIRDLQLEHRCIAPDLIGFGLSSKPESFSYSPAAHCRNLRKLVETLDLREITLVVHDFGGPVGLSMALDVPDRIARICMMNTWMWDLSLDPVANKTARLANGPLGPMTFLKLNAGAKAARNMVEDKSRFSEEVGRAYAGPLAAPESRWGVFSVAKQMGDAGGWYAELWRSREKFLSTPIQLIWGMKDSTFGERALNRMWHEFPLADVVQLESAGHALMEDNPKGVVRALQSFIRAKPLPEHSLGLHTG